MYLYVARTPCGETYMAVTMDWLWPMNISIVNNNKKINIKSIVISGAITY